MTVSSITGLGGISAVGRDILTTCASIRAGIVRPSDLPGVTMLDYLSYEEVPVIGSSVSGITDGFVTTGRWIQLALSAFNDLCLSSELPEADDSTFWSATELVVVVPKLGSRFFPDEKCTSENIEEAFLPPFLMQISQSSHLQKSSVTGSGRVGFLEAIADAGQRIDQSAAERVIILVADSLVDVPSLDWLNESDRLKSDDQPCGMSPGEAAIAVLIESPGNARSRGATELAQVVAIATRQHGEDEALQGVDNVGELSEVIREVLTQAGLDKPYAAPVISDINGEVWRSRQYGSASVLLQQSLMSPSELTVPLNSTGDVGAAASALQLAVACRSHDRGYAHDHESLLCCSENDGSVGAAMIKQAGSVR